MKKTRMAISFIMAFGSTMLCLSAINSGNTPLAMVEAIFAGLFAFMFYDEMAEKEATVIKE